MTDSIINTQYRLANHTTGWADPNLIYSLDIAQQLLWRRDSGWSIQTRTVTTSEWVDLPGAWVDGDVVRFDANDFWTVRVRQDGKWNLAAADDFDEASGSAPLTDNAVDKALARKSKHRWTAVRRGGKAVK